MRWRVPVRGALTAVAWAWALYPLWFLFVGRWTALEALWGAGVSLLAGTGAALVASRGLMPPAPKLRWLTAVPGTAWQTAVDFGVVMAVLVRSIAHGRRGPVGRFVRRETAAHGTGSPQPARRTWLAALVTYSPNAYVIDVDRDTGQALLHDLRPRRASEEGL